MQRLYLSIIFVVIGSLFFISWGLDTFVEEHIHEEENTELLLYKQLVEGFSQQLNQENSDILEKKVAEYASLYAVTLSLVSSKNIALPKSLHGKLADEGGLLLATELNTFLIKKLKNHPQILLQMQLPSLAQGNQKLDIILTGVLYLGVCSILLLWLLPLTRRLFLLTNAAAKIGAGDLAIRVPRSKYSYIRELESSFNAMAAQIEKLMADNKILARSLSHDIRTPISCLRFGIEAALDAKDIDKKNNYIERMEVEITRMEDMTAAFLEYAGLERKGVNLKLEPINIGNFIANITNDFQPIAAQHQVVIVSDLPEKECLHNIDAHWLYQALQNLISNAIHYANSKVSVSFKITAKQLSIYIEDDGPGIPQDKVIEIFDPFVRLDADRSRENGHFGLGLAIAAKVVDWHKGTISAKKSNQLKGAKFALTIPH